MKNQEIKKENDTPFIHRKDLEQEEERKRLEWQSIIIIL